MLDVLLKDWNASNTLTLVAAVFGLASVIAGLISYNRQQKWQRQMHVIDRMDNFVSGGLSKNALVAIDWINRPIVLDEASSILVGRKKIQYGKDMLVKALEIDFQAKGDTSLVYLRDCFEAFFDQMAVLENQQRSGLISISDVAPYLGYYAKRLLHGNDVNREEVIRQFWEFSEHFYGEANLKAFFEKICLEHTKRQK